MWDMYSSNNKISTIEKYCDNKLIQIIKDYKNTYFGVEPIICYLLAKEYEVNTVKLIMISKINRINDSEIKERMRDIYV